MDIKITSTKDDKYFDRKIINFSMEVKPKETIKLSDVRHKLSEEMKDGFLIVYTMRNVYGSGEIKGIAHLYKDESVAKRVLQGYILKKNGIENGKEKRKEIGKLIRCTTFSRSKAVN